MGALDISNTFHCYDMFTIDANQWGKTSVHGGMVKFLGGRVHMRDNLLKGRLVNDLIQEMMRQDSNQTYNSTRTTPSLCTAQLGARQPNAPQIFKQGDFGIDRVQRDFGAVQVESESVVPFFREMGEGSDLGLTGDDHRIRGLED